MEVRQEAFKLSQLPVELLVNIFTNCDAPSLGRASCVCKLFRSIIQDRQNDAILWQRHCWWGLNKQSKGPWRELHLHMAPFWVSYLLSRVIGQPQAIYQVVNSISSDLTSGSLSQRARALQGQASAGGVPVSRIKKPEESTVRSLDERPRSVLYFVGPPRTGENRLANVMAKLMSRPLLRFQMATFATHASVSRLVGVAPGYRGYGQDDSLVNKMRTNPNAVVVFEDIEVAHRSIIQALLGVLDTGRLSDGQGRTASFSNAIIIMMSNLGAQEISALDWKHLSIDIALERSTKIVRELVRSRISPPFAFRIGDVVPFRLLQRGTAEKIMRTRVGEIANSIEVKQGVTLTIDDGAWLPLVRAPVNLNLGVRPIIQRFEGELDDLLRGLELSRGDIIRIERNTAGKLHRV